MTRPTATIILAVLLGGCASRELSEADLVRAARDYVEAHQKALTGSHHLPAFNSRCTKVDETAGGRRVILGYGFTSYDTLWVFTVELSPGGKVLKVEKTLEGHE